MIYLNYAALSPTRPEAEQAISDTLNEFKNYLYSDAGIQWYLHEVGKHRSQVANLLNVRDPSSIAFVSNASTAHYLAVRSFQWESGDHVLTSTHENLSIVRQFRALEQKGVRIHRVQPSSPDQLVQEIQRLLDERVFKAIMLSHVSHVDGRILPIQEISDLAKEHGVVFMVDGAQAVGHIPVDLGQFDYDVYFFTGHKWCAGPLGTGAMVVNKRFLTKNFVWSVQVKEDAKHPASQFEIGTQNIGLIAGLGKACNRTFQEGLGTESLQAFREQAKELLGKQRKLKLVEWEGPHAPGMLTVQGPPGFEYRQFVKQLADESQIIVKLFTDYPDEILPAIRLSWSKFMKEEDFHAGMNAIANSLH